MASKWIKTDEVGIYQREGVSTPWLYARFMVRGTPKWQVLPTAKTRDAAGIRKKIIRALKEKPFVDLDKLLRGEALVSDATNPAGNATKTEVTLGALIKRYLEDAVIGAKEANVRSLRYVLNQAGVRDVDNAPWTVLSADTIAAYTLKISKAAAAVAAGNAKAQPAVAGDNFRSVRMRRSAASRLRQARSVFARKLQPAYRELGMGDISGFFEGGIDAPQVSYQVPPRAILEQIAREYPKLEQCDPGAYAAFLVGLGCGLRNSEAAIARWDWIEKGEEGTTWLNITLQANSKTKNERNRWVEIPPMVLAALAKLRGVKTWQGSGSKDGAGNYLDVQVDTEADYLIPGTSRTDRYNAMTRRLSKWLRAQGLDAKRYPKSYYELRKLLGSIVAKREKSIFAAAQTLGNLPTTAERYYVGVLRGPAPLDILGRSEPESQARPA